MKIFVTNDDGIYSHGIRVLAEALKEVGDVLVIAPDRERTAAGHALTLHKPLRLEEIEKGYFAANGTPTDCVNLGINGILKTPPDIVVSGINKGGNLGEDVTYSGTVSAAVEGTILGVPSIAISLVADVDYKFEAAASIAVKLTKIILKKGLPKDTLLNINVPNVSKEEIKGVKITRLGKRIYDRNSIIENIDPRGRKYYWIGGSRMTWEKTEESDFAAIEENMISVTPLCLDLTNYAVIDDLKKWDIKFNNGNG